MDVLKTIGKAIALILGMWVCGMIAFIAAPTFGVWISAATLLFSVGNMIRPQARLWVANRFTAVILTLFSALSLVAVLQNKSKSDERLLAALRLSDPAAYSAEITARRDESYVPPELKALDPQIYLAEIRARKSDAAYMDELAKIDPTAQKAELDRRSAEADARREAESVKRRAEIADLEEKARTSNDLPLTARLSIYDRLAGFNPGDEGVQKERSRLRELVDAERMSATIADLERQAKAAGDRPASEQLALYDRLVQIAPGETRFRTRRDELAARAEAEKIAAELVELRGKLAHISEIPLDDQRWLYARLAHLDPSNAQYAKERDRIAAQVRAIEAERQRTKELEQARRNPEKFLEIVDFRWSKTGFGTVMVANFTVKNKSGVGIKDFIIRCEHSAGSGTVIDSNTQTVYEIIPPGKSKTFRDVN